MQSSLAFSYLPYVWEQTNENENENNQDSLHNSTFILFMSRVKIGYRFPY